MPEYSTTNKGVLFNEKEIKSDKHPTMTGKLDVEGKEYRIAAWEKEGKAGTFLTLAISEPREKGEQTGIQKARAVADQLKAKQDVIQPVDGEPISLDDIPF
jgi:hypothetical protein